MIFTAGLLEQHGQITAVLDQTNVSGQKWSLIIFDTRGMSFETRGYNVSQSEIGRQINLYSEFIAAMEKLLAGDFEKQNEIAAHVCGYIMRRLQKED